MTSKTLEDSAATTALTKRHDEGDNGGGSNCHMEYKEVVVPDGELHVDGQGSLVKRKNHFVKSVKVCTSSTQGEPLTDDQREAVVGGVGMISAALVIAAIVAVTQAAPSSHRALDDVAVHAPKAAQHHPEVAMKKRNLIDVKATKNRVCIRTKANADVKKVKVL
ncbi:hypothetical protein BGZ93_008386 [Podila epicladia]|nr:hypothetical protein BGZ92_011559 [Podila epicladia]KAG0092267.1 hypothetical protein BGZ93_008386 [Podila epicladia]